ncbi:MAG: hypothetical protein AB7L18_14110, partial [Hyphomicrobiaceae bacterium]
IVCELPADAAASRYFPVQPKSCQQPERLMKTPFNASSRRQAHSPLIELSFNATTKVDHQGE